jgi:flagellar biosynthesis GTPase FlhF
MQYIYIMDPKKGWDNKRKYNNRNKHNTNNYNKYKNALVPYKDLTEAEKSQSDNYQNHNGNRNYNNRPYWKQNNHYRSRNSDYFYRNHQNQKYYNSYNNFVDKYNYNSYNNTKINGAKLLEEPRKLKDLNESIELNKRKGLKEIIEPTELKEPKESTELTTSYIFFSIPSLLDSKKIDDIDNEKTQSDETKTEIVGIKCNNPNCDHKEETIVEPLKLNKINNLGDLIKLGNTYHCKTNKMFYNINLKILFDLIDPLTEIKNMIGLTEIKNKIIDQILYFLQGYHNKGKKCDKCDNCKENITCMKNQDDMLHTVITGAPGVGKTMLAKKLGMLYKKIGILATDKFNIVSRSDLIGKYLGETAIKTQQAIDNADGGVLFIDEAYSLGNTGHKDSFSKECIDTLTKNLSEKKTFICIIAGYKEALNDCLFKHNEGLSRRFTFRYELESYKWRELKQIFESKIKQDGFELKCNDEIDLLFRKNVEKFTNNGGDMETLYIKSKLSHCRNIIMDKDNQFALTYDDIKNGMDDLIATREKKETFSSTMFI